MTTEVLGYCGSVCFRRGCKAEISRPNSLSIEDMTAAGWDTPVSIRREDGLWTQGNFCPRHARWWSLVYWARRYAWRLGYIGIRSPTVDGLTYGCFRCKTPTKYVNWHVTDVPRQGDGCFCLCVKCWTDLAPEQRLPFYRRLFDYWMSSGGMDDPPRRWSNYAEAILNERD